MNFDWYLPLFGWLGDPPVTMRDIFGHFIIPGTKKFLAYYKRRKKLCRK